MEKNRRTPRRFRRIDAAELARQLEAPHPPLVLDIRRESAFGEHQGVPGAVPLALDRDPLLLPDVARDRKIVCYCL
jgi:rhodanese-related sulfurtransferase